MAVGIDVVEAAVQLTRKRGVSALRRDVFHHGQVAVENVQNEWGRAAAPGCRFSVRLPSPA